MIRHFAPSQARFALPERRGPASLSQTKGGLTEIVWQGGLLGDDEYNEFVLRYRGEGMLVARSDR
jgi:hypothetical protein